MKAIKPILIGISFSIFFLGYAPFANALENGQNGDLVIGQPDFITESTGTSAIKLKFPYGIEFDSSGNLWVADLDNSRLLRYSQPFLTGQAANLVLGQQNFTAGSTNGHGTQANAMNIPFGIAIDSSDSVWVTDFNNNRVTRFDPPFSNGQAAAIAIGQTNLQGTSSGTTATTLQTPEDLTFDSSGNLWVADSNNHRVLRYDTPFSTGDAATLVLGQKNFTAGTSNGHGTQANALNTPKGLDFDADGNLWISDSTNNRVLKFDKPFSNGQTPSLVLGQADFSSITADRTGDGNEASNTLHGPQDVRFDSSGNLWVVDDANNRILRYTAPITSGQAATLVLGQADFMSGSENRGLGNTNANAGTLRNPGEIAFGPQGNIWISDGSNARVYRFPGGDHVLIEQIIDALTDPKTSGDNSPPTLGMSSTGRQVVENGFSYQSNLGGFTELDADLGLTHMDSLKVAVGGMPNAPPGEIRNDAREKLNERGLGDVAKTFDNISDTINALDNFLNRLPDDVSPSETTPESRDISNMLENLKQGIDQSRVNQDSHQNPQEATQINNLLDRIAQKIAEIEDTL